MQNNGWGLVEGENRAGLRADRRSGSDPLGEGDGKRVEQLVVGRLEIGATGEVLRVGERRRGLQIVGEGDDGQQNGPEQRDSDELNGDGRECGIALLRALAVAPGGKEGEGNRHPGKIEENFHCHGLYRAAVHGGSGRLTLHLPCFGCNDR